MLSKPYSKKDFIKISWNDLEKHITKIYKTVSRYLQVNNSSIDAIIPILRAGSIPATQLAYKFSILRMLPIQYKYLCNNKKVSIKKILKFNPQLIVNFPKNPACLLVVECNHSTGTIAKRAIKDIKNKFPNAKIIYVSITRGYYYKDVINHVDFTTFALYTNENKKLSKEQCKKLKIKHDKTYLFPWEDINEELAMLNDKEWAYQGKDDFI